MTENEAFYKWSKFKNGVGSVARVSLDVSQSTSNKNEIAEHYSGQGFTSQGNIEEVSAVGYDSWKIAARHGLEYGFSFIDTFWQVDLKKIEGLTFTDTNQQLLRIRSYEPFLTRLVFNLTQIKLKYLKISF